MIEYQLIHLNELKGFMPPFVGTDGERQALRDWLATLNPQPPTREPVNPGVQAVGPAAPTGASKP